MKTQQSYKPSNNLGRVWLNSIINRLHKQNKNWLCLICGGTGSGKSYSAVSIAQDITKPTNNQYYVVFEPETFLEVLNRPDLKRGDIIIFDEAGVGMSSRRWYSLQNRLLGCVLQTFRNLNIGVIFTTPDISFIDIQARKLFHTYLLTNRIDHKREVAVLKIYDFKIDGLTGKTYIQAPAFYDYTGNFSLETIEIPKPSTDIDKYEESAAVYKAKVRLNAQLEIAKFNNDMVKKLAK